MWVELAANSVMDQDIILHSLLLTRQLDNFVVDRLRHHVSAESECSTAKLMFLQRFLKPVGNSDNPVKRESQQQQERQHPVAASTATATDSKTYKQPFCHAAILARRPYMRYKACKSYNSSGRMSW